MTLKCRIAELLVLFFDLFSTFMEDVCILVWSLAREQGFSIPFLSKRTGTMSWARSFIDTFFLMAPFHKLFVRANY